MITSKVMLPYLTVTSLQQELESKNDLFSIYRLVASFMVLFAHAYHIYGVGADPLTPLLGVYTGHFAVYIFFSISGFFIIRSAMEREFFQYITSRLLRIYPALIVCNVLTVLVIIPMAMGFNWYSFFISNEALSYIKTNSVLNTLKFTIDGVFINNPDQAINGSLWTLPVEIRAYIIALLLVMIGVTSTKSRYNALLFVVVIVNFKFPDLLLNIFPIPGAIELLWYFFLGGALYINREHIYISPLLVVIALTLIFLLKNNLSPVMLAMLVVYSVISSGYVLARFITLRLKSDYSYGCYLYAYPLSQLLFVFMSDYGFYIYLFSVVIMTYFLSFLSWHVVEKPVNDFSRNKFFPKINKIVKLY